MCDFLLLYVSYVHMSFYIPQYSDLHLAPNSLRFKITLYVLKQCTFYYIMYLWDSKSCFNLFFFNTLKCIFKFPLGLWEKSSVPKWEECVPFLSRALTHMNFTGQGKINWELSVEQRHLRNSRGWYLTFWGFSGDWS